MSIADQLARVNQLRDSLTAQFAKMDAAIGQINNQGSSLSSIITAMNKSNNN